eukprot:5782369-Ditylum_brightwellii.AAC.1
MWEDGMDSPITRVPPHIKQLVDIELIKDRGMKLPAEITRIVIAELKDYLENKEIGGGELTDACVKEIIDTTTN